MYVWLEAVLGNTDSACYSEQCLLFWTVFSALCLRWHRWVRPFGGFNRLGWFLSQPIVSTPFRQHKNETARVSCNSHPINRHLLQLRKLLKGQWKLNAGILGKKWESLTQSCRHCRVMTHLHWKSKYWLVLSEVGWVPSGCRFCFSAVWMVHWQPDVGCY